METVKAKIKGTNAILEGCICDDSFFVSVDHDIFERYALCEVEICKDSLQVQEFCKENQDSFTSLEEAAEDCVWKSIDNNDPTLIPKFIPLLISLFISGAYWQKEHSFKPTQEHLDALDTVYKTHGADNACRHILLNLLNQLKEL